MVRPELERLFHLALVQKLHYAFSVILAAESARRSNGDAAELYHERTLAQRLAAVRFDACFPIADDPARGGGVCNSALTVAEKSDGSFRVVSVCARFLGI